MPHNEARATVSTRLAKSGDLEAIRSIYNQAIEDRSATLETAPYDSFDMEQWWSRHDERYAVVVAVEADGSILGWASLNRFSERCAHSAIADLSVYVKRDERGRGVGRLLIGDLERRARGSFHKIVLHALNANERGKRLYVGAGFREVGVLHEHGMLDDAFVDIVVMEKLLP